MRPLNRRERWGASLARCLLTRHFWTFALLVALAIGGAPKLPLLICFMAAGTRELKSDGTLQLSADGKSRLANGSNDTCCCCAPCSNCSGGSTPCGFTVTFSGTTGDGSCFSCVPFANSRKSNGGNFNGTFDLTQNTSNGCKWEYILASGGSISWNQWTGSTCSGTLLDSGSGVYVAVTALNATTYSLEHQPGTGWQDYTDTISKTSGICTDFTSTNDVTGTGCVAGTINFAHGGSATATAVF